MQTLYQVLDKEETLNQIQDLRQGIAVKIEQLQRVTPSQEFYVFPREE